MILLSKILKQCNDSPVAIYSAFSNVSVMFDPMKQQHSGRQTNWAPFDDDDGDDDGSSSR